MPKTALIINPWITDFKLYDEWMHPLGLYFLISLLNHNNWNVGYINCLERNENSKLKRYGTGTFPYKEIPKPQSYKDILRKYKRYGLREEIFRKKLQDSHHPDAIFIGSNMTYWIEGIEATVKHIRDIFPEVPIIIGGISASLIPEVITKALPDVSLFSGSLFDNGNQFKKAHPLVGDLSFNGWYPTLIDAYKIIPYHFHGPLLTSFGCPFRCSYCASSHLQKKYQSREQSIIIDEMRYLIEYAEVTDFAFYDDALLYKSETNFLPLMEAIRNLEGPLRLHVPNGLHVRWLNEKVIHTMLQCGFKTIRFGYESSNSKYQKETNAKTTRKQCVEKVNIIQSAGFKAKDIGIYVMGGLPNQTMENVLDECSFVASLGVQVKPVFLSPVPRTPLFLYYVKKFPELRHNPLFHNDTFFITQLPGWSYSVVEEIKYAIGQMNKKILG